MKKITIIVLFLCLGFTIALAGDKTSPKVANIVSLENNFRNTAWYNTNNRAGLAFSPLDIYHVLDLRYDMGLGQFRSPEKASEHHNISLNTSGSAMLGKFMICGDFSFRNNFENKANYNTLLYEIEEDMPYYISDPNVSNWIKQEYDLGASLTSPAVANIISFGLQLHYLTKVGAKQKDPRSETYRYNIEVIPSIVVALGKNHYIGINGLFDNNFERSVPSLNNYMESPKIIYNKGLGEGVIGKVGGNDGLKTVFYKGMKYGGGLQYSYERQTTILLDVNYTFRIIDGFEHPSLPKRLGTTKSSDISGSLQILFGKQKSDKFTLTGLYSSTSGIEHVQSLNQEAFNQRWEVLASNTMSTYKRLFAELSYDHLFGNERERGYDWITGAEVSFADRNFQYNVPLTTFTATSAKFDVNAGKQFKFKKSGLLLALNCGYNLNLGGNYKYGGNKTESWQVEYYQKKNQYLTTDFLEAGARIAYSIKIRKVDLFLNMQADWLKPFTVKDDWITCSASFGIVF